ncbi:DUF1707 SHOCT-like domain-containing protein [Nocardioides sp.]|uniref:DUF1707 SHOCT-like domain-containing protein n=1 Tax=Nocardioides sp. TaxID=35761 RepID=UPI0039E51484
MSTPDPSRLRISDQDRFRVEEILRQAAGEGRITIDELDQRIEATHQAKTYGDLVPITMDLPADNHLPADAQRSGSPLVVPSESHLAIMSGLDRGGVWTPPVAMTVNCFMGGTTLDYREAVFATREVVVIINAFMGGGTVIVGPDQNVVVEGTGIMGGYSGPSGLVHPQLTADSPTIRVKGLAIWGGVSVERKQLRGKRSLWRR